MPKVLILKSCKECPFYLKYDVACNHPQMMKKFSVGYQVYFSWLKFDDEGFPSECPLPYHEMSFTHY